MDISIPKSYGDRDWTRIDNWTRINKEDRLALESLLEWEGDVEGSIRINDDGRIQKLRCGLRSLKPPIGRLKALEELDLSETFSLYKLPKEIGNLSNLIKLNLRFTDIKEIPSSIAQLQALEELDLHGTKVFFLPQAMENLKSLKILNLGQTDVTSLPHWFGRLGALEELHFCDLLRLKFDSEKRRSLPAEIWNLSKLVKLNLNGLCFESIPPSISQLQNLELLSLKNTENLKSLPEEIGTLSNLKILDLTNTPIRSFSPWIGRLVSLEELNLFGAEHLKSFPEEMKNLKKLKLLKLAHVYVPKLPSWICQWEDLQGLNLHHTFLAELPDEIGNLSNLVTLDLSCTEIKSLPSSIGRLKSLETLIIVNCWNLKRLPEAIGNLGKLKVMNSYGSSIANAPSIEYALACHRYRSKIVTSPMGNIWTLILKNAKHAFRAYDVDIDQEYFFNLGFEEFPDDETGELRGLEEHDAIFRILVDHRTSFVETLTNRKKRKRITRG